MEAWGPVPNKKNSLPRNADTVLTSAWSMGGTLLDLPPWHLDLVADHIAQLRLDQWPQWLIDAQMQIDPEVIHRKLEQKT